MLTAFVSRFLMIRSDLFADFDDLLAIQISAILANLTAEHLAMALRALNKSGQ